MDRAAFQSLMQRASVARCAAEDPVGTGLRRERQCDVASRRLSAALHDTRADHTAPLLAPSASLPPCF